MALLNVMRSARLGALSWLIVSAAGWTLSGSRRPFTKQHDGAEVRRIYSVRAYRIWVRNVERSILVELAGAAARRRNPYWEWCRGACCRGIRLTS